jgi:hypothetical protein
MGPPIPEYLSESRNRLVISTSYRLSVRSFNQVRSSTVHGLQTPRRSRLTQVNLILPISNLPKTENIPRRVTPGEPLTFVTLFGILRLRTRVPVSRIPHLPHLQTDERLDKPARFGDTAVLLTGRTCCVTDDREEDGQNALKVSDSETYVLVWLTQTILSGLT